MPSSSRAVGRLVSSASGLVVVDVHGPARMVISALEAEVDSAAAAPLLADNVHVTSLVLHPGIAAPRAAPHPVGAVLVHEPSTQERLHCLVSPVVVALPLLVLCTGYVCVLGGLSQADLATPAPAMCAPHAAAGAVVRAIRIHQVVTPAVGTGTLLEAWVGCRYARQMCCKVPYFSGDQGRYVVLGQLLAALRIPADHRDAPIVDLRLEVPSGAFPAGLMLAGVHWPNIVDWNLEGIDE